MKARSGRPPVNSGAIQKLNPPNPTRQTSKSSVSPAHATILIVDDEPNIADFLCLLLEDEGYRVCRAADGLQAIDVIELVAPALVISDVKMPGLGGEDLARRVVIGMFRPSPRIILMSAMERPKNSWNVPFIGKPFDIDKLLGLVDEQMGQPILH